MYRGLHLDMRAGTTFTRYVQPMPYGSIPVHSEEEGELPIVASTMAVVAEHRCSHDQPSLLVETTRMRRQQHEQATGAWPQWAH